MSGFGITGSNLVAGKERAGGPDTLRGVDPRTGKALEPAFHEATPDEIGDAVRAAGEAFEELRSWPDERRAALLRAVADAVESAGDQLVDLADRETALGTTPRLRGELARTTGQLRSFARLVEDGWYVEAIIDPGGNGVPDVRRMLIPLGPVGVFGASNFPLAFGVPGGDTASALAAGCPVVAKGHPSHPATSEACARAVLAGLAHVGAPAGTFSMVQGAGVEVGAALATAPEIRAIGFTGSLAGGRALHDLAAARPEPIPVFAEMGSINPVFVLPGAAAARGDAIADGYAASMIQGVGQFCTKPGVVFVPEGENGTRIAERIAEVLRSASGGPLLNERICATFRSGVEHLATLDGVAVLLRGAPNDDQGPLAGAPSLVLTDLDTYQRSPALAEEHFGPVSAVVTCPTDRLTEAARSVPGSLTATIQADEADRALAGRLQELLADRVGRMVYDGYPTGVAVVPAMHHGGPYPATTAPAHTSVGMTAIRRFMRPLAFQDAPAELLPPALVDANPLGILRLVDWTWTTDPIG